VAEISAKDRYQTLTAAETAWRLDQALRLSVAGKDGKVHDYSLGEYALFRRLPSSRDALQQVGQRLRILASQANPSYRAVVQEAYEVADLLARGKTKGIPERLQCIATSQAAIAQRESEIEDYLNWYEATQSKTSSGVFAQVLDAERTAEEALPRRRDPISVYLDSIEMETN